MSELVNIQKKKELLQSEKIYIKDFFWLFFDTPPTNKDFEIMAKHGVLMCDKHKLFDSNTRLAYLKMADLVDKNTQIFTKYLCLPISEINNTLDIKKYYKNYNECKLNLINHIDEPKKISDQYTYLYDNDNAYLLVKEIVNEQKGVRKIESLSFNKNQYSVFVYKKDFIKLKDIFDIDIGKYIEDSFNINVSTYAYSGVLKKYNDIILAFADCEDYKKYGEITQSIKHIQPWLKEKYLDKKTINTDDFRVLIKFIKGHYNIK
ncbi:hypothetical protein [Francisella sp. SYW-2]|uniref:hypothetical protein n=1 Tax=Francisella sp. SYW-2 TaxID=2610886 RepID=UPI00123D899E|nr:hypothetical protein [Francisella sp. SYW-2]